MAWSLVHSDSDQVSIEEVAYPTTNSPNFAGDGIILALPQYGSLANGDVVVFTCAVRVRMDRDGSTPVGGGWTGINSEVKFPCIPGSADAQSMTSYGGTSPSKTEACSGHLQCRVFQVTDAATHLTLGNWLMNLSWDPGSAPNEWNDPDIGNDGAYIIAGVAVFRSDTNPTWAITHRAGSRGCGYVSYPAASVAADQDVYVQTTATLGDPNTSPALDPDPVATEWVDDFIEELTGFFGVPVAIGLQYALGEPTETADWLIQDGGGNQWLGVDGGDGSGFPRGSLYRGWTAVEPGDPVPPAEGGYGCFFRWDERWPDMLKTLTDGNGSQLEALGRTLEDRDQQLEDYIAAHFTCDCACEGGAV